MRAASIEAGDGDHRRRVVRQKDLAGAGEGAEPRAAVRAVIVPRRGRIERQVHRGQAKRLVRARQEDVELGPIDVAVED